MRYLNSFKIEVLILTLLWVFISFNSNAQQRCSYKENVGDIPFDPLTDAADFSLTGERIRQYYNFFPGVAIGGEKPAIINYFNNNYTAYPCNDSGYITIRFIVNYQGKTDRFRIQQMDFNYQPIEFANEIVSQLLAISKSITGWKIAEVNNVKCDYYQYLTFIIENGEIKEVLP